METKLKIFNEKTVRTVWNADEEDWYFSVVDVIAVLTDSNDPKQYIKKMRDRDPELNSSWGTICTLPKMTASDGKSYKTTAANTKGILRLIQSVPSPKAEPFKLWLAQVGSERLDEIADPEKAIQRGAEFYREKGYSEQWINQRLRTIEVRKKLTDEWRERGIEDNRDYAILTNDLTKAWSGLSIKEYKELKSLKKENLRDNMTDLELIFNMLAEATTTAISQQEKPTTFEENRKVAKSGGQTAKGARSVVEKRLGHSIISATNAKEKEKLLTKDQTSALPSGEEPKNPQE